MFFRKTRALVDIHTRTIRKLDVKLSDLEAELGAAERRIIALEGANDILKAVVAAQSAAAATSVQAIPESDRGSGMTAFHATIAEQADLDEDEEVDTTVKFERGLRNRIDEIWGDGLSLEEIINRRRAYDQRGNEEA